MIEDPAISILCGPGYFYCEKAHCRMSVNACLKRQNALISSFKEDPFMICRGCVQGKEIRESRGMKMESEKEKRLCKDCGLKPTIHPNSPYCSHCMARKANEKRNRIADKPQIQTTEASDKNKSNKPKFEPIKAFQIDFGKHAYLLERIGALAEDQVRTIEEQIIFLLKESLSTCRTPKTDAAAGGLE